MGYFKDLGGNKYKLIVEVGKDIRGKRKRRTKTVSASGVREVRKLLVAFENDVWEEKEEEKETLEQISFSDFVDQWKNIYAYPNLAASTREVYYAIVDYFLLTFDNTSIREINTMDLADFFAKEILDGKKQLEKKFNVMSSIFKYAKQWGVIESNPMLGVERPKTKNKKREPYNDEELALLATHLPSISKFHQRIIKTTVECALRRGEVAALATDTIDIENNRILIKRSLQYTQEKGLVLKTTKTDDETYIHVTQELMDELKSQCEAVERNKKMAGSNWIGIKDNDGQEVLLLFANELGVPYHPNAITRFWGRFLKRTGLRAISFHDLRHSSASSMIRKGVNPKTVQNRLRHKNIRTTMDRYVHSDREDDIVASQTFEGIWNVEK